MASGTQVNAEEIASGSLSISPSQPSQSWNAPRILYPGESVSLSVTVESEGSVGGKDYELEGQPQASISGSTTLWTRTDEGGTGFSFQALNAGNQPGSDTVTVSATWKEVSAEGGEGEGEGEGELDVIEGWAIGFAEGDRAVFTWEMNPRLQFTDGHSEIRFSVSASANGATIDLAEYTVSDTAGWTVESDGYGSTNLITGSVKSTTSGKGVLKIDYNEIEQGRSEDELAFAELDLGIAKIGNEADLAEDRLSDGGTASPPHEMDPGSVVIAPVTGSEAAGSRSKMTLKGNGGTPKEGTFTLKAENSANVAIYESATGGSPITLPRSWNAVDFSETSTLYVGATPFTSGAPAQDGTLTLTYKRPLQTGPTDFDIKDSVRVRLLTIELSSPKAAVEAARKVNNPTYFPKYGVTDLGNIYEKSDVPACTAYYKDVIDSNFQVQPFDVDLKFGPGMQGALWSADGNNPTSGTLNGTGPDVKFSDPSKGGVYKFNVVYASKTTLTYLALPLAGGEVKDVVSSDLLKADAFATTVNATYNVFERNWPPNGLRWFNNGGAGDYLGRPDNTNSRTIWKHNQVDSNGMGAVATWFGYPTRVAKMSNFIVAYAAQKIGVTSLSAWIAQVVGQMNDSAAQKSWDAGWAVAGGSSYTSTTSAMSKDIWDESDDKNQKLWPNSQPVNNYVSRAAFSDADRQFSPPGFLEMTSP